MHLSIRELDLIRHFPSAKTAKIQSVSKWEGGFLALLHVWETEHYKSVKQRLVYVEDMKIHKQHWLDRIAKWSCVHYLSEGNYLMGGYTSDSAPAFLAFFHDGKIEKALFYDKGFSTRIDAIAPTVDGNLLLKGSYWVRYNAGSHDDFYAEPWTQKITKTGENTEGVSLQLSTTYFEEGSGDYYHYHGYEVFKHDQSGKLRWDQDTSITGMEKSSYLRTIAPYLVMKEGATVQDGVWVGGKRTTEDYGTGRSLPTLFRVTSGGTRLDCSHFFEPYPECTAVLAILPDPNRCYILGETLIRGEGNGLFLLTLAETPFMQVEEITYINFQEDSHSPVAEARPSFGDKYLWVENVFTNENGFTIFLNSSQGKDRDMGKVWEIIIERED